jgi:glycosyltransferase involved in cell wall biosynthesis
LAASLSAHRALHTFSRIDRFLAVSRFVRTKHIEVGFDPDRIRVKSNFVPSAEQRHGPGGYLLFLGRISREKGLDTVIRALPDAVELVVAGDGPDRDRLEPSVGGNVCFTGSVSPDEVPPLLRGARALVVPSRWYEGQPRVILEAFATGVPVLASRIGGLPELVRAGYNGDLVDPDDVDGWRAAIGRIADPDLSLRLGAHAHESWLARFTPEVAIRELEGAYAEAASSRAGAR